MYLIVTKSRELAEQAKKAGAHVFQDTQFLGTDIRFEQNVTSEEKIRQLLANLAIKPNLSGYDYLKYIMSKCAQNPTYYRNTLTKVIYPECAVAFGTTTVRIERAIRHALERSFEEVPEVYIGIFKRELQNPPKNSEFIRMMSEVLALK